MSILIALLLANLGNCCIPVSLPDDTDGFTTVISTISMTTTLATTTPPNCLTQCPAISSFTACSSVTLPSGYTCQAVSPSPTSTRTGTTCSFLLDCTSLGSFCNPNVQSNGVVTTVSPAQSVTFTCPDGGSKWTDSNFNTADDGAVCATPPPTCLTQCSTVPSFTDCSNPTVTTALSAVFKSCLPPSPTPMSTRAGTTCSFTLVCTGGATVNLIKSGVASDILSPTTTFTCMDGTSQWLDEAGLPRDFGVCAM